MARAAVILATVFVLIKLAASQLNACSPNPCEEGGSCFEARLRPYYICICTANWMGQNCDVPDIYSPRSAVPCNENFYFDRNGTITSPGWPNFYGIREYCLYQVKIPNALSITLNIDFFVSERFKDELFIVEGPLFPGFNSPRLRSLNGTVQDGTKNVAPLLFDSNQVTLLWESDFNINRTGFSISYNVDVDNCWRQQCQGAPCVDLPDDSDFQCLCPEGQTGRFCESGIVVINETTPVITTGGNITEGSTTAVIIFDLNLNPSHLANFEVFGNNLWHVAASLSSDSAGNVDFVSVIPTLSRAQASTSWLPPEVSTLTRILALFPISGFVCSETQYLCATINKSESANFVLNGDPDERSLTGCTPITCRGVEISETTILNLDNTDIRDNQLQQFRFDIALDSVANAGSVQGSSLWSIQAFASSRSDGSIRIAEERVLLRTSNLAAGVTAGSRTLLEDLTLTLDFSNLDCSQLRYFCVEVRKHQNPNPNFTLTGVPNDDVLTTCQELNCGAVQIIQTGFSSNVPRTLLANSASNVIDINLTAQSLSSSASISGTNLWQVEIFTNSFIDGSGQAFLRQLATLPVSSANTPLLQGGDSFTLNNVQTTLDLTDATCSQVQYICARLQMNPVSQPQFTLEGIPSDNVFVTCVGYTCTELQTCDDIECQNGGTCNIPSNGNPMCLCPPGWTGEFCADPVNACDGILCLFGGTCVNSQFSFTCLCTLGRSGMFCELQDIGVDVVTVTPVIISGSLREGVSSNPLNLNVDIRTDANGDSLSGTGLWNVQFFLNDQSDGSGPRRTLTSSPLTPTQTSTPIAAGSTGTIRSIFATPDLRDLTCTQAPYICAELSKGSNPNPDFLLSGSLVGCTEISCQGVEIVDSFLQFSIPPVLVEGSSNSLTFDFVFTSSSSGGSVTGDNLWNLLWYLSTRPDDTGSSDIFPINLNPTQSGVDIDAGTTRSLRSILAQINTQGYTCNDFDYICARLEKNPSASVDFTLTVTDEGAVSHCVEVTCRGVEVTSLNPVYMTPNEIRSGQNNLFNFNLGVNTNSGGASVRGTDLWMVEIFTNTNILGGGTTFASSTATIPFSSLNQGITAGIPTILNNIQATLDLRSVTCSQVPFICVRLDRNQFSNPDFTLVNSNGGDDIIQCQQFTCQDPSPCENNLCQNGATCITQGDGFSCVCTDAFIGQFCGTVNPCFGTNPCLNNGGCIPLSAGVFTCQCVDGYTGNNCQIPPDPCLSTPCQNFGTCIRVEATAIFSCICPPFFEGQFCEREDPCRGNPCGSNAQCLGNAQDGTFQCICLAGSKGDSCQYPEPCVSDPCLNNGVCTSTLTGSQYTCTCQLGYQGVNCQIPDPCISSPCINGGTCVPATDGSQFQCICLPSIFGNLCQFVDPCRSNPCQNNGICSRDPQGTQYTCTCVGNFIGTNCENEDPCASTPCMNNGVCSVIDDGLSFSCTCPNNFLGDVCQNLNPCLSGPCQNGGSCRTTLDGSAFICDCPTGFFGITCDVSSICATVPCRNGGTCTPINQGRDFQCTCPQGFLLPDCRTRDPCSSQPCQNQGTCVNNADGTYTCLCPPSILGINCENPDPCQSNPCQGGGTCTPRIQGLFYSCECPPDTYGVNCESRDPCRSNPCVNDGTCYAVDELTSFQCICRTGYIGPTCAILAPCDLNPCRFGGTCVPDATQLNGYQCMCPAGRTGATCTEVDLCASLSPCLNNATCVPNTGEGIFTCLCPEGFTGERCQTQLPCVTTNPCQNGGTCIANGNTHQCLCLSPYGGLNCQFITMISTPSPTTCSNNVDFPCHSGECISQLQRCDQVVNCEDGFSDEIDCPRPCRINQFACEDGLTCIATSLMCDGTAHCGDNSDETLPRCFPCASDPCLNGGLCNVGSDPNSYVCTCLEGFTGPTCEGRIDTINDAPQFISSPVVFISEGTAPSDLAFTLQALDPNGDMLEYFLNSTSATTYFFMNDFTSGQVFLLTNLDRETIGNSFNITVVVRDSQGAEVEQIITVYIEDINDNAPVLTNLPARTRLSENASRGEIFQVDATDLDLAQGSLLSFSIESVTLTPGGQDTGNLFEINGATGSVFLTHGLDFETTQQYILNIRVSDLGTPSLSAFGTLTIDVDDIQDVGPVFINTPYDISIPETQQVGSVVQRVTAVDQDVTNPSAISYRFVIGNEQGYFNLDQTTGNLTLARPLDRDDLLVPGSFTFTIRAEEVGSPTFFDFNTFTITVFDVQDEPPAFNQNNYEVSISEAQQAGTQLPLNILVSDGDRTTTDMISLQLQGPSNLPFSVAQPAVINEGAVPIVVSGPLDYESIQSYVFQLVAMETNPNTGQSFSATSTVTVNINDVNDNDPIFTQGTFTGSVIEGAIRGTTVTTVSATDRDSNQNAQISYAIIQGNEDGLFVINPSTGEITTQSPSIDFETLQMRYTLVVEATNPTLPVLPATGSSQVEVIIDITDANDNAPVFDFTNYNTSVTEIADPGTIIIRVTATDEDSGPGGEVRYSINSGNAEGQFQIDPVTGDITLRTSVDREIRDFYSLTVVATDQAEPSNIGLTTVDIHVRDINDNDPVWTQTSYETDLSEGAGRNTFVVRVQAEDADIGQNAMLTYSLSPDNQLFVIDPVTGEIRLVGPLDRETSEEIMLTVIVTDNGNPNRPASTPATVTIRVTDINDNPPMFENAPYNFEVEENQPPQSPVGQVFITDVDEVGTHTFSFLDDIEGFRIDPNTGEIFTTTSFDRETQSYYQFVVVVSDGLTLETTTVNVTITDVNDNDPVFSLPEYEEFVPEDFPLLMEILTVSADDIDGVDVGDISYRFQSGRNVEGPFTLDLTTGLLELSSSLDREDQSQYTLTVIAVDTRMGNIQRTGTTTIQINVTDVNDNGPLFTQNPYPEQTIPEDVSEGEPIIQVATTDADLGGNSRVSYQITQGNVGGAFVIDETTGVISRGPTPLDRETLDFYLLVVEAFDPVLASLPRDTAVVTIVVSDVNDVVPEFTQSVYSRVDLPEDAQIGTNVIQVQAVDQDLGLAGEKRYSIVAGNEMGYFTIDPVSGIITVSSEFPSITDTITFNLTVTATDQSSPFNVGTGYVVVTVLDAGEVPPVFVLPRYEADTLENREAGSFVVQVNALVEGQPANLRYSLDPNAHPDVMMHFEVNGTTGVITIRSPLDREVNDFYAFTVFAQGETASSSTAVWVTVLDANDNTPVFLEFPVDGIVLEGSAAQTVIGEIRTTDSDIGRNAQVNYLISDGNRDGAFTLRNSPDGTVTLITTRPLNREFMNEYNITVTAFDGGEPSLQASETVKITVGDVNDNAPLFTSSSFSGEIVENVLRSSPVASVSVMDSDLPSSNNLVFSITRGNEEGKFEINNQGQITLTSALDRETVDSYQLTVQLRDPTYDSLYQVFVPVYITVLDQNDNAPSFSEPSYQSQVGEGLSSVIVTTVAASDPDLGVNSEIRFNVTGPNAEFFSVDPIQGFLTTSIELDREMTAEYIVTITATDQALDPQERLTSTTTVTVEVTDINDTPPEFLAQQYGPYFILEASPNAFIDNIQAEDPDLGSGGRVTYSLIGEFRDYFVLNPSTGLLTVNPNRPLDYEQQQQINITVIARDAEGLQSTRDIVINVVNVNDNTPRFEGTPYSSTISENATVGTLAFIAAATDADLGPPGMVTYAIIDGNPNRVFWIDPENGEIYINKTLDREVTASYSLVLQAVDNPENPDDRRTTTTRLTITVSDADDVPPAFPTDRYFGTILENSFIGTPVDMDRPIIAVDSDEISVIVYTIAGNDSQAFTIDPVSGELRSSEVFDREVKSLYSFTVIATDSQGSYDEATVDITILDVNDNEPTLGLSVYNFTIPENSPSGSFVGILTASDADGQQIQFSIQTGGEDKFVIDSENGEITVAPRAMLDREERETYTLTVAVTDQGSPQLTTTGRVNIFLSDINDSPPVFEETEFTTSISESDSGSTVGVFTASDPDLDAFIRYFINSLKVFDQNGRDITSQIDSSNWFNINEVTGEVVLVEQIDREQVREINLVISARDENGVMVDTRTSDPNVEVEIFITDVNDNAPNIQPIDVTSTQEESSVGTIITTVVATDPDGGDGGRITYSILNGTGLPILINPDTGRITVREIIDREVYPWINFTIIAIDSGSPSLNSTVDVNLRVTDINDNNPSFNQTMYVTNVNESASVGECFTFIIAEDADAGDFGAVTYRLSGGDGLFEINEQTGEVCLLGQLDRESVNQYTLIVTARDNPAGSPNNRRESATRVVIDVTDTNEFAPRADQEFPFDLPEGTPPGTVIGVIDAIDPDTPDKPLIYIISDTQPPGAENLFTINRTTGEIILIGEIDADNSTFSDQYRINVIISDGGNPERTVDVVSVISIQDINDTPPTFDPSYYNVTVSESFATRNPIVTVSATDPDENSVLTYMIVGGNNDESFLINADTGEIRFLGELDHETQQVYRITVKVNDQNGLQSTAEVDIHVTDNNDHAPRFSRDLYTFSVCENLPNGTEVGQIEAMDNDLLLDNNEITYTITSGNEDGGLVLDPATGIITTTRPFDQEVIGRLTLTVEAKNARAQSGTISDTSVVIINIEDKNDNSPLFDRTDYSRNIRDTDTSITIEAVFAQDIDSGPNGVVKYRITDGNVGNIFSINENNGVLTLNRPVSSLAEQVTEFRLIVEAYDQGTPSRTSNVTVIVTVGDENDKAPVFVVPRPGETLQLPENEPPLYFLIRLNATDRDLGTNGQIIYEFYTAGPDDHTFFFLNRTSGELFANFTADRETKSEFTLIVLASDQGDNPRATPLQIIVEITDKNDNEPAFETQDRQNLNTVPENVTSHTVIGVVTPAVDPDVNSTIYYFIVSGNDDNLFEIDQITGEITVIGTLDRESRGDHTIIIKATNDRNYTAQGPFDVVKDTSIKVVSIPVGDVNDNPPFFLKPLIVTGIPLESPLGSTVITVTAMDADAGGSGMFMYRITRAIFISNEENVDNVSALSDFYIEEDTGRIITSALFTEDDLNGLFQLEVEAVDKNTGEIGMVTVQIRVLEQNQRVVLVVNDSPQNVRIQQDILIQRLQNITGGTVRIDDITAFVDENGVRDSTRTMVFFHVIDTNTNEVLDADTVTTKIDENRESINTLFIGSGVIDVYPLTGAGAVGGIGWLGALLLALALLLLLGALLFIILLCCLPRWFTLFGAGAGASEAKTALVTKTTGSYVGNVNAGFDSTDAAKLKEYEAQEMTVFMGDEGFHVDEAQEALILTSMLGGGTGGGGKVTRDHFAFGDGSSITSNGGINSASVRRSYYTEDMSNAATVGTINRDGSVSVLTGEDATARFAGTFPRMQETSFIESRTFTQNQRSANTLNNQGRQVSSDYSRMVTNEIDREQLRKQTAAEIRAMLHSRASDDTASQYSTSTARFDNMNRSITVNVGYDDQTDYNNAYRASRQQSFRSQGDIEAVVDVGYDHDRAMNTYSANKTYLDPMSDFGDQSSFHEEEHTRREFQEDDMMVSEERHMTKRSSHKVYRDEPKPREEIVNELFIISGDEPFAGDTHHSVRSGGGSSRYGDGIGSYGDGHSVTSRTLSSQSDDELRHYNVGTMSTTRGDGWSSITDFDNLEEEDMVEETRHVKKTTRQMAHGPEGRGFYEIDSGF